MRRYTVALAVVLALAACKKEDEVLTIRTADGKIAVVEKIPAARVPKPTKPKYPLTKTLLLSCGLVGDDNGYGGYYRCVERVEVWESEFTAHTFLLVHRRDGTSVTKY